MGELWKDINQSPLHNHHSQPSAPDAAASRQGMMFQDFLGPPPPTAMPAHHAGSSLSFSSAVNNPQPPVTLLSLNSGPEFPFLESSSPLRSCSSSSGHHLQSGLANVSSASFNCFPFEALASSSPVLPCFGQKKRSNDPDSSSGDRRHKRMIKNRESAARSRARKQAYTNELELKVAHLMDENAKLREQQEQLSMAAAAHHPKKHALHRSSTAPF